MKLYWLKWCMLYVEMSAFRDHINVISNVYC